MKEVEKQKHEETPVYNANVSEEDIMGRSDFYVNPLTAMYAQNTIAPPAAFIGIPPYNPFFLEEWKDAREKEDELKK